MVFNILKDSIIRNDTSCRHDNRNGYEVVWDENDDYKGYDEFGGMTSTVVWDRAMVGVTTSGVSYVSPSLDQTPIDASVYNLLKISLRLELGFGVTSPSQGKIQYQTDDDPVYDEDKQLTFSVTPDNAYHEYTVDMSQQKLWQGNVTRIRLYPIIDGAAGTIIHLKHIRVQSGSSFSCDTNFNGSVCDKYSQYSHPCPWVGAGGSCSSGTIDSDHVTIVENLNDKLVVNINDYGDQGIRLRPGVNLSLKQIAGDIEDKLSNIGIGGYAGARVDIVNNTIRITGDDTREASSTVVVSDTEAARSLGFFGGGGEERYESSTGEDSASRYEPAGTRQLSKSEIAHLYQDRSHSRSKVSLDPRRFSVQAGRSDFASTFKDKKIDFSNKTIIDFNNPVSNNGILTSISYSGDGNTQTSVRVFRPKADGSLQFITSVSMGIGSDGLVDRVFDKEVAIRVRKGDLIGLYNGKIDTAKLEELPNTSYFIYNGNLTEDLEGAQVVFGRGEAGLRLFAHGSDVEDEVVLDIEFDQPQPIEEITVVAEEESRKEFVNLTHALVGGINGGPYIEGSTGLNKFGNQAPSLSNLGAISDGVKYNEPNATTCRPSWVDTSYSPSDLYDQTDFSITMDFAKAVPVFFNIYRVVLYFRDENNIKYFSVRYPFTTDDTDTLRYWGPVSSRYTKVSLEDKLLEPNDHPLYDNPIQPTVTNFTDSYQFLRYRKLDLEFDPVRARSLQYEVKNYDFEEDRTKSTFSNFALTVNPHILEIEVFAVSEPEASISDNFYFESSEDGQNYVLHTNTVELGETSAQYLIGYPVNNIKLHILPQSPLSIDSITPTISSSPSHIKTNGGIGSHGHTASSKDFTSVSTIDVTNEDAEVRNFFVDIAPQISQANRCILWNKLGNDLELSVSEIGPSPSVVQRDPYYPREYNVALGAPAYILDPFWLFNKICYISYDHGDTWEYRGNTCTDYNLSTKLTSENPNHEDYLFTYILIDLGSVYALDTVQFVNSGGDNDFLNVGYCNLDVDDPSQLDLNGDFLGTKASVRWIRLSSFSSEPGQVESSLSYLQASLDVFHNNNKRKLTWLPAPELTNYTFGDIEAGGEGWNRGTSGFRNYYCVDLEEYYSISNIFVGPSFDSLRVLEDLDSLSPGDAGSLFGSSSKSNSNIAYSDSFTSDPTKVSWGSLGDSPRDRERWILLRTTSYYDEVAVHTDDNVQENKDPFTQSRWWSTQIGSVTKDKENFREGVYSIRIDYPEDSGNQLEEAELTQSLGIDHYLARRDFLRILFYVSDVTQMDLDKGYFSIGRSTSSDNGGALDEADRDTENYYKWNFSEFKSSFETGWNEFFLPFTNNFKVGEPYFTKNDLTAQSNSDTSGRSRFRWFKVAFAGVEGNSAFHVNVDGIRIDRGTYLPCKWGRGRYFTGSEYAKFPIHNFNVLQGTVEFFINPDWTKAPGCNSCEDSTDHTIFRIFNSDGFVLGCFMTGKGLRIYLTDGNKHYYLTDSSRESILWGVNTHLAVVWDLLAPDLSPALSIYINNKLSSTFEAEALSSSEFFPNPNAVFMLGGLAWDGVVNNISSSCDAVIDNVRVYTYPIYDFSYSMENEGLEHRRPVEELIEISVDGVNFYGSGDRGAGLPILVRDVYPNQKFSVYVRNKEGSSSLTPEGRVSYLKIIRAISG